VAGAYFRLVSEKDVDAVVALFAEDAEMIPTPRPASGAHRGHHALRQHYGAALDKPLLFRDLHMYVDGRTCVVEVDVEIGHDRQRGELVDVFTLDEQGRIARLSVYKR
jgi:ketosteroid isomerase-like protein